MGAGVGAGSRAVNLGEIVDRCGGDGRGRHDGARLATISAADRGGGGGISSSIVDMALTTGASAAAAMLAPAAGSCGLPLRRASRCFRCRSRWRCRLRSSGKSAPACCAKISSDCASIDSLSLLALAAVPLCAYEGVEAAQSERVTSTSCTSTLLSLSGFFAANPLESTAPKEE